MDLDCREFYEGDDGRRYQSDSVVQRDEIDGDVCAKRRKDEGAPDRIGHGEPGHVPKRYGA